MPRGMLQDLRSMGKYYLRGKSHPFKSQNCSPAPSPHSSFPIPQALATRYH